MIRFFTEVGSTQDEMKSWIREGEVRHLDSVLAERQISGRGRQGAQWVSSGPNFFASILISPGALPLTWVPLWVGVAACEAVVRRFPGVRELRLKWPNDLVIPGPLGDAKLGGILCEKVEEGIIAGIGINVHSAPPVSGRETVSLAGFSETPPNEGFCRELLEGLLQALVLQPDLSSLRQGYEELSLFKPGELLAWTDPASGKEGSGCYEGIGEHGELIVQASGGRIRLFSEEVRRLSRSKGKDPAQ